MMMLLSPHSPPRFAITLRPLIPTVSCILFHALHPKLQLIGLLIFYFFCGAGLERAVAAARVAVVWAGAADEMPIFAE